MKHISTTLESPHTLFTVAIKHSWLNHIHLLPSPTVISRLSIITNVHGIPFNSEAQSNLNKRQVVLTIHVEGDGARDGRHQVVVAGLTCENGM